MSDNIIGRARELAIFDKIMRSESAEFLAIYGRRRVGKTFLVYEYFKRDIVFSVSGSFDQPLKTQLGHFFKEYLRITQGRMEAMPPKDWETAFAYLTDYLQAVAQEKEGKTVVFIDEMPWLDTPRSGFVPALEYFWNQHASKMPKVVLIACGSTASWIKKKLLKSKGGLYNRVTKRIKLEPFTLRETAAFCVRKRLKFSHYQIARLYMVMGGVPFYLNELSAGKSVDQLIDEICFSATGLLSDEFEQVYYSLFKNAENHIALVEALARHPYGLVRSKLVKQSGLGDGGTFARALEDLTESGFVLKYQPFQKKSKDSIYRLIDMYSLFYLRFIRGNVAGLSNAWQQMANDSSYLAWCGYAYENICLLHIPQVLRALGLSGTFTQASSWYHQGNDEIPGAQIDLLIDRKDGMINLCEAKFSNKEFVVTKGYAAQLRRKRSVFELATGTKKTVVSTLITTWPAIQNAYYHDEIHSEVTLDDLFVD
jgi:uncharacterized protein